MHPREISIQDYEYPLPDDKIAYFPLEQRDQSKLLIFQKGTIREDIYRNLAGYLAPGTLLVFNDTRVINARILFAKPTGAVIEIFCLEPQESVRDYAWALNRTHSARWKCLIGGAGKWKQPFLQRSIKVEGIEVILKVRLVERRSDTYVAEFSWDPGTCTFAEILEHAGNTPLPPYIKRAAEASDTSRYQTIYSRFEGSVAAPTAGLHFTQRLFDSLEQAGIETAFVTLHVGAGTFKPVKSATMEGHEMHAEYMDVSIGLIHTLIRYLDQGITCVGTTSVRTLESLYWMGRRILNHPDLEPSDLEISQWEPYEPESAGEKITAREALTALGNYLESRNLIHLFTRTQIMIAPGYQFRIVNALVTNFHQPKSTLLLLVAALTGGQWRRMYDYALNHDFRFLSYGDGCLIFNGQNAG